MVEIRKEGENLERIVKINQTEELYKKYFSSYERVELPQLQYYWAAFNYQNKLAFTISYTNKNMLIKDKIIKNNILNEQTLMEFGKAYEKIWDINNFEIIVD